MRGRMIVILQMAVVADPAVLPSKGPLRDMEIPALLVEIHEREGSLADGSSIVPSQANKQAGVTFPSSRPLPSTFLLPNLNHHLIHHSLAHILSSTRVFSHGWSRQ